MKEKDLIGYAHKVLSFRMNVIKACKLKGIEPPTDEQISCYINDYGFNVTDFMSDYTEHEGMFRTPFEDFKACINNISWGDNKPTEDEIATFYGTYGNNISLFCQQRTIKNMASIERKLYLKTIETLKDEGLVALWNTFIDEARIYGEDSYIYDLKNRETAKFLAVNMSVEEYKTLCSMRDKDNVRFLQWTSLSDNSIRKADPKGTITAFWREIVERILLFPDLYAYLSTENWMLEYVKECIYPILLSSCGIEVDTNANTISFS